MISPAIQKVLLLIAALFGASFLARGVWLGSEGLSGVIRLDQRGWILTVIFILSGIRLILFVRRRWPRA